MDAKETINENDESRKRFEVLAREMFKKFKACLTLKGVNEYRGQYDAVNIIYRSLQKDRDNADISYIIQELHSIISEAIQVEWGKGQKSESKLYDISQIDFDRLRKEYEKRHGGLKTAVQNIKESVERRLARMVQQNPLRMNFQKHYEAIVEAYNREKDRVTIEQTFEDLLRFVESLDTESHRAIREGLDEETLALFDLLVKPDLSKKELDRIKKVASQLLATLKTEKLKVDNWRAKQATRDAVRVAILNFLYDEETGLPASGYTEEEVKTKAEDVYVFLYQQHGGFGPRSYAALPQ